MDVTCIADVKAVLGEGPVWDSRTATLTFVDIKGRRAFRWHAARGLEEFPSPHRLGSLLPRASGGYISGTDEGIAAIDLDASRFEILFDPEEERATNRFNDAKTDRSGRLFLGTMDDEERLASGAFYRLGSDLGCTRVDDGFRVTNGPAFSPDGRVMYANDSALQITFAYDLDAEGTPTNRREFARFGEGEGYPDGMTVDAEGCLWIAFWDGWCLRRLSPTGERLSELRVPVQRPTSCTFGGENLDRLFITSARIGLEENDLATQPSAGGLFVAMPGVRGIADQPFAG